LTISKLSSFDIYPTAVAISHLPAKRIIYIDGDFAQGDSTVLLCNLNSAACTVGLIGRIHDFGDLERVLTCGGWIVHALRRLNELADEFLTNRAAIGRGLTNAARVVVTTAAG
jgi:hypothetical protein